MVEKLDISSKKSNYLKNYKIYLLQKLEIVRSNKLFKESEDVGLKIL